MRHLLLNAVVALGVAGGDFARTQDGASVEPQDAVVFVGTTGAQDPATGLDVGDVARLYEVLDLLTTDPTSLGFEDAKVRIQLAANAIYRLDPTKGDGGRVILADGAELAGGNVVHDYADLDGNPRPDGIPDAVGTDAAGLIYATNQTILDGGKLADDAGSVRGVIEPILNARIHNLTVWSAAPPPKVGIGAAISIRPAGVEKTVDVSETILEGGRRGIHVASLRAQGHVADDVQVRLLAERNVFRNFKGQNGWGVHFHQAVTSNLSMSGLLRHNRFYGNKTGLFMVQNGSVRSETTVVSTGNLIEEQHGRTSSAAERSAGVWITRQMESSAANPQAPHENRMRFTSTDDAIWNNPGSGGILIESANRGAIPSDSAFTNNDIDVQLIRTRLVKPGLSASGDHFLQNRITDATGGSLKRRDITITGPIGTGAVAVSSNDVRVLVRRVTSSVEPMSYDADPVPLVIRNDNPEAVRITITGSPAFTTVNEGTSGFTFEGI
jgi:hypothetical protein